jgi:outer membrane protein OmpA-like peptidoglycan-associated protein
MSFRSAVPFLLIPCLASPALAGCTSQNQDIANALADIAPAGGFSRPIKTVYFAPGSARLTTEARQIIRAFAAIVIAEHVTTVRVTGHADTLGSTDKNERLSQRRALMVAAALVEYGVPRENIMVDWTGESDPPIPTSNETPEAANRAVTMRT